MGWRHVYSLVDAKTRKARPLRHCPECWADLGAPEALTVELSNGRRSWEEMGRLEKGRLVEPSGCAKAGLHSATFCTACGSMLCELEMVLEEVKRC